MEASRWRCSIWWWFWAYFVINTFHTTLFSHVIIGIDHGRLGVTATTPEWFVVRRGRPSSVLAPDNKSLGCCCRNSLPTVINPLNTNPITFLSLIYIYKYNINIFYHWGSINIQYLLDQATNHVLTTEDAWFQFLSTVKQVLSQWTKMSHL